MQPHSQVRRRRRRVLSCLECRRRKVKCNREQPCDHCIEIRQVCLYQPPPPHHQQQQLQQQPWQAAKEVLPPITGTNSWRSVILSPGHGDAAVLRDAASQNVAATPTPTPTPPPPPASASSQSTPVSQFASGPLALHNRPQMQGDPLSHPLGHNARHVDDVDDDDGGMFTRRAAAHDSKIVLDKTRILRWSHWMGAGQEFGAIFACYMELIDPGQDSSFTPQVKALLAEAAELLQKCKRLARSSKIWRPSRLFGMQGYDLVPPSRQIADTMATEYFNSFESTMRILHIPSFWKTYSDYWDVQNTVKMETRLTILLVIAIGSSIQDRSDSTANIPGIAQIHQWIYAAQAWLAGPLEKDRLDTVGLQIYCLVIIARQIYSVGGDLVWMSLGSLLHRAMQLGLHYDPKHFQGMPLLKAELRRRLWYTILELLMQASLDTAMPPRISPDEFDTEPPSNINDSDLQDNTAVLHPQPDTEYTDTFLQLQLISSLPARIRIVRYLNAINTDLSYPEAMGLSSGLSSAHHRSTQALQAHATATSPFQRNMLDFLTRRFVVPLHSPFACEARTTPAFHYSLKACTEASLALICPEPDARFARLLRFAGGLFREGLRSANTAVSLDLVIQTRTQRADGTLHRTRTYRDGLRQSVVDMLELCEQRIHNGETNVKSYVFLKMVLAMTDAMESGAACEVRIADSARDSLAHCYGVLESSIGSVATNTPTENGMGLDMGFLGMDMGMDCFFSDTGFS